MFIATLGHGTNAHVDQGTTLGCSLLLNKDDIEKSWILIPPKELTKFMEMNNVKWKDIINAPYTLSYDDVVERSNMMDIELCTFVQVVL